ncbi:RNA polymerase sigma factor [Propionicimonas sp.]|uniref:RNA polymerase sigma factor n=1 Tax=Propionicimonas sp. TaxID=1955623 RepID=UPI0039E6B75B
MTLEAAVADGADEPSFEAWVKLHSPALQRFAYQICGSREDASDAVQDALIGLYPRWGQVVGHADAYVRRSILNANISRWRKFRGEVLAITPNEPADPSDHFAAADDADAAGRLFASVSPRQRAALVLRFYEQFSFAEIALVLDVAEPTARSLVHRALASLRATWQEDDHA